MLGKLSSSKSVLHLHCNQLAQKSGYENDNAEERKYPLHYTIRKEQGIFVIILALEVLRGFLHTIKEPENE